MAVVGSFGTEQVILENAAQEETLQRLVEIARGGFGDTSSGLNAANRAATGASQGLQRAGSSAESMAASASSAGDQLGRVGSAMGSYANSIDRSASRMATGMRSVADSPFMVADTLVSVMDSFKDAGVVTKLLAGAGSAAAGALVTEGTKIEGAITGGLLGLSAMVAPGLTAMFAGMFVKVLKDTTENFINLQKNGAILGGTLTDARLAAHGSGLSMKQFTNVMGKAGSEMSVFGGQTLRGAKMFGDLNKAVINGQTGRRLLQLGIGFEDMGVRTAEMIAHLTESGISFESNAVAVDAAKKRVVELAMQQKTLAAINGTTIEQEKEKQRMQRKDAQLNAIMLGMGEKEREGIQQLTAQFPQFGQFIKETVAFGGPVSKGALMQQAQMGATTDALGQTIAEIQAGGGKGAVDALKELQKTSPALRADLDNQAELVKLSLVSTSNAFIQTATSNFQGQFEMFNKANSDVIGSITDDFEKLKNGSDDLTNTVVSLQQNQQQLTVEMTKTATALISESGAIQNILVGTTKTLNNALTVLNQNMGVAGGLPDSTTGQVVDRPRSTQQIASATNALATAEAAIGANTAANAPAATGTQPDPADTAPIVTSDPATVTALAQVNTTLKNNNVDLIKAIQSI